MIELTEQQIEALKTLQPRPPQVINPQTHETFVLLPVGEYERLKEQEYDDSDWTREEIESLAWEAAGRSDWEEYDDVGKPS